MLLFKKYGIWHIDVPYTDQTEPTFALRHRFVEFADGTYQASPEDLNPVIEQWNVVWVPLPIDMTKPFLRILLNGVTEGVFWRPPTAKSIVAGEDDGRFYFCRVMGNISARTISGAGIQQLSAQLRLYPTPASVVALGAPQ